MLEGPGWGLTYSAAVPPLDGEDENRAVAVDDGRGPWWAWGRWWKEVSKRQRLVFVGLVGVLCIPAGVGTYLAMIHPPYQQDEASHVGYVLSLRDGVLPELQTEIPTHRGDRALELAKGRAWPFGLSYIHIARNPPFPYLVATGPAEITSLVGVRAGPLLGVRLMNVAGSTLR